jgi:hypothetical protein
MDCARFEEIRKARSIGKQRHADIFSVDTINLSQCPNVYICAKFPQLQIIRFDPSYEFINWLTRPDRSHTREVTWSFFLRHWQRNGDGTFPFSAIKLRPSQGRRPPLNIIASVKHSTEKNASVIHAPSLLESTGFQGCRRPPHPPQLVQTTSACKSWQYSPNL